MVVVNFLVLVLVLLWFIVPVIGLTKEEKKILIKYPKIKVKFNIKHWKYQYIFQYTDKNGFQENQKTFYNKIFFKKRFLIPTPWNKKRVFKELLRYVRARAL